ELAKQIFPLCENFLLINHFIESRSQLKKGLVNHAFAAALRAFLLDYQAMVAHLEHQFRLGRLSMQGLWFYCQPMIGPMQALSAVIQKAAASECAGSAVLNLLQSQAKAMAGDNAVRLLPEKMTQSASSAYLGMLERWVYEGVIDDLCDEFFVAENRSLQKVPISENSKFTSFDSNHQYLECIKAAYGYASGELLNLIREKYDPMGKLRSIKHYLLIRHSERILCYVSDSLLLSLALGGGEILPIRGDFLVHFMDIAQDELMKRIDEISSLLDLALRTTAAAPDPYHEDLTYWVAIHRLLDNLCPSSDFMAVSLCREFVLSRSSLLCRSMLKFINSLLHYLTFEAVFSFSSQDFCFLAICHAVLELNWHMMHNRLKNAKSIDEVIQYYDFLLERCLKECLLLLPELLKGYLAMQVWCQDICANAKTSFPFFLPSKTGISLIESTTDGSLGSEKFKQGKTGKLSQVLKLSPSNLTVNESVQKFEREFDAELQSLGPILSSSSQAEPYLTHLAECILGVGKGSRVNAAAAGSMNSFPQLKKMTSCFALRYAWLARALWL
ncbi:Gamma tubulin complex component, C-terminal, partial [Dillenia turbinata]